MRRLAARDIRAAEWNRTSHPRPRKPLLSHLASRKSAEGPHHVGSWRLAVSLKDSDEKRSLVAEGCIKTGRIDPHGLGEVRHSTLDMPWSSSPAGDQSITQARANAEINFRNGGSADGSLARRGGRPIPRKGWDPFFPPRLGLPTQHSQRPLAAPALSQAILKESLGSRPGRNGLSAVSSARGQGLWTLAFGSSWQAGHFASAIWKFLSAFALNHPSVG